MASERVVMSQLSSSKVKGGNWEWSLSSFDQSYYGFGVWLRRYVCDTSVFHFEAWVFGLRYCSERRVSIEKAKQLVKSYGYLGSTKPEWVAEEDWGEK